MSDTRSLEEGTEWPRRYTSAELHAIAKAAGLVELPYYIVADLQDAVSSYQWGRLEDDKVFPKSTNKGRRHGLRLLSELCSQGGADDEIETAFNGLDGTALHLLGPVGPVRAADRQALQWAAECALSKIPASGPDRKRARRQFIGDLAPIYIYATGWRPGRHFFVEEKGPFLEFVRAALDPFHASQGCEGDIKPALRKLFGGRKDSSGRRKKAVATEH